MADLPPRTYKVNPDGSLKPPTLYAVTDIADYKGTHNEHRRLSLIDAAQVVEDCQIGPRADDILSDIEEGVDWPMRYEDEETGRVVLVTPEDSPDA